MAPLMNISTYTEQFGSPGRGRVARPRPSSAHRRNNPHPRPDFLFPRRLSSSYMTSRSVLQSIPSAHVGRPLFPPVRNLSFHIPEGKPNLTLSAMDAAKLDHMPAVSPSTTHGLPFTDKLQKLQLTKAPAGHKTQFPTARRNPQSQMNSFKALQQRPDHLRTVHPHSAQGLRQPSASSPQRELQHGSPPAAQHHLPHTHYWRSRSNSTLDSSGGYSCFHVVKPYQAGHYIIHPEFVSECRQ